VRPSKASNAQDWGTEAKPAAKPRIAVLDFHGDKNSTAEQLASHAFTLVGLARTADFRWWGDRISVTVSIGDAQALPGEELAQLLDRAKHAMQASRHAGGNHVTHARGGAPCLPS